ncbi:MAG: PadR family transcriptional regulator [Candidatus Dormibacteraeota bacterium]|uniref:PadR family transcriptional regulator n=1 Tax=Candidatus Dormiibacter inghamiae TaxID=3127013 RepID=A0A934K9G0_9BACT|nr:PadR family transcriptional regulator [Candidatus Dormibacteraeota bacterium]MBJ7606341.1 PadR family transcriptional regulator [Candidatus Dormibacteraeota bacterium]
MEFGSLGLAVMGLLHESPMHPYEVVGHMRRRHLDQHIKLNFGSLYHTFDKLERQGLVEAREVNREGRRPERTVYRLTPDGRRRFAERLVRMLRQPEAVYSDFEGALAFLYRLPKEQVVDILRQRADALDAEWGETGAQLKWLTDSGLSRLSVVEMEFGQDRRQSQAGWCRRLAAEIESGELEWSAGWKGATSLAVAAGDPQRQGTDRDAMTVGAQVQVLEVETR